MESQRPGMCVRIYVNENDTWSGKPLGLAILSALHDRGCAGATLLHGVAGFGSHGQVHRGNLVDVIPPLPLIVEWIDTPERVEAVLPSILPLVAEGLVVQFPVTVVRFTRRTLHALPERIRVADVMTKDVVTVREDTPLAGVVSVLIDHERRSVPVLDADRRVVGIITNGDLVERAGLRARVHLLPALGADTVRAEIDDLARDRRTARDIMTSPAVTVGPGTSIRDAAHLMTTRRLKRLPVVDADGRLVGIVSRVDLLRTIEPVALGAASSAQSVPAGVSRVGEIMARAVPTVRRDTPLPDVLDALLSTRYERAIVVDDGGRPLGFVSTTLLLGRIDAASRPGALDALMRRLPFGHRDSATARQVGAAAMAADLMTASSEAVTEETPIAEAAKAMLEQRRKIMPVVDADGVVVGMIDRAGLLRALHDPGGGTARDDTGA